MGGAAFVATEGDPEAPHKLASVSRKGTLCTCSFEEEVEAMKMASTWIKENCQKEETIQICTDRQSLCMALQSYNPETDPIREILQGHEGRINIQWIPGHSKIPGNNWADSVARAGTSKPGAGRPVTLRGARTQIWRTFGDELWHDIMEQVYGVYNKETEALIGSRKDQVAGGRRVASTEHSVPAITYWMTRYRMCVRPARRDPTSWSTGGSGVRAPWQQRENYLGEGKSRDWCS